MDPVENISVQAHCFHARLLTFHRDPQKLMAVMKLRSIRMRDRYRVEAGAAATTDETDRPATRHKALVAMIVTVKDDLDAEAPRELGKTLVQLHGIRNEIAVVI